VDHWFAKIRAIMSSQVWSAGDSVAEDKMFQEVTSKSVLSSVGSTRSSA